MYKVTTQRHNGTIPPYIPKNKEKNLHFVFWDGPQFQAILSLYQFQAIFLCQAGKTLSSDGPGQPRIVSLILFVFAAAARSISASLRPGAAAFECRGINAA